MTETVYVGIYEAWADWEIGLAVAHVNRALWQQAPGRYEVKTVAETLEPVTTMGGLRMVPDVTIDEITPDGSAMLILAGADTWDENGNTAFAKKAREFLEAGVPVAAICGATYGLAAEGLLNDREHTSGVLDYVAAAPGYSGAEKYRDDVLAVTDGNLITASPVGTAEFAREVLAKLEVYTPEVLDAWYKLFGRQDPSGYPVLMAAAG
jgi:putative intracellular protease/amidase